MHVTEMQKRLLYGQIYMTDMNRITDIAKENGIELEFTEKGNSV